MKDGHYEHCYLPVPNWAEDLSECMAPGGPWERLKKHCTRKPSLHVEDDGTAWVIAYIKPDSRSYYIGVDEILRKGETEAPAICHAFLAVAEKMKEATCETQKS